MRVLYVALTRAKEKLIITGLEKDLKKSIDKKEQILKSYNENQDNIINKNITQKYISYLDWIELVYLKRREDLEEILDVKTYKKEEVLKEVLDKDNKIDINIEEKINNVNKKNMNKIKEKLEWEYKYNIANNILTKSSVTKVKNMRTDLEEVEYKKPEFLNEENILSGAEKGTLMHLLLQKLDEKIEYDEDVIIEFLDKLEERGIINKKEREAVDKDKLYKFTKTNIWKEMKNAKEVQKEKPFYINIPVKEIYDEDIDIDDNILVQGVIDLYYITNNGELVLLDYKTDKVKKKEELINKYKEQLNLYKIALEKALSKKVDRVYIYSVTLNEAVEII